jgi:hypothetical protein
MVHFWVCLGGYFQRTSNNSEQVGGADVGPKASVQIAHPGDGLFLSVVQKTQNGMICFTSNHEPDPNFHDFSSS